MAVLSTSPSSSPPKQSVYIPYAITFIAGASYGLTTVIIGQPLDTIKTRMQGFSKTTVTHNASTNHKAVGAASIFWDLYKTEGLRGLYRGGLPLMIGGSMMRSAQFGVRWVTYYYTKLFLFVDFANNEYYAVS